MALDVKISFSWTNYCRLCLLDSGIMLPLFEGDGQNRQLGHKIETCLHLVTYDGDPLPRRICHKCLFKLNQMFEFRTMALESYERLQTHLLPLKHVPEVQQYLLRTNQLQKSVGNHDSTIENQDISLKNQFSLRNDLFKSSKPVIHIKSEKEWMEEPSSTSFSSSTPLTHFPQNRITESSQQLQRDVFASSTLQALSVSSGTAVVGSSEDFEASSLSVPQNLQLDTLKRKRSQLHPCEPCLEDTKRESPRLESVKVNKRFMGPKSRRWKCIFCKAFLSSKKTLTVHMDKCLKCQICHKEFISLKEKAVHEAEKHINVLIDVERKHLRRRCTRCDARFSSSLMLGMHSRFDHQSLISEDNNSLSERKPIRASSSLSSYEVMSQNVAQVTAMSNENEDSISLTDTDQDDTTSKLECSTCHRVFFNLKRLEMHLLDHSETKDHICSLCKEVFSSASLLLQHGKLMHNTGSALKFQCSLCDQSFESQNKLNLHQRHHISKETNSKRSLNHADDIPKKTSISVKKKTLSCHTCFEEFDEEDPFILHLYKHATEQSDDESIPIKKSRKIQSSQGSEEAGTVAEQFSVKCERCHVVCRSKEYYKVHLATHVSKAKTSFPCSGCAQVFRNVEALNRHTCSGKQLEDVQSCCLDCGQALVIGEDHVCDNKCPQCEKVFKSARGQRLHFVHKHGSLVAPPEDMENYSHKVDSDLNPSENEESENKEDHSTYGGSEHFTSETELSTREDREAISAGEAEASNIVASSPPMERLPPDGAPLDDPLPCGSDNETREKFPQTECYDANHDNISPAFFRPYEVNEIPLGESCENL